MRLLVAVVAPGGVHGRADVLVEGKPVLDGRRAGECIVIEEPEPVVDAVLRHRMHRDIGNLGQSFRTPGETFDRLNVVAGVFPDGLLGVRPGASLLAVGYERADDCIGVVCFHQSSTFEAFDLHGFPF